jgi:hypothetical protein
MIDYRMEDSGSIPDKDREYSMHPRLMSGFKIHSGSYPNTEMYFYIDVKRLECETKPSPLTP